MSKLPAREQLVRWLRRNACTQAALAKRVDTHHANVSRWISGTRVPHVRFAARIESVTGIPAGAWAQ